MTDVGFVKNLIQKYGGTPSPSIIKAAVDAYLEDHPEAVAPIDDTAGEGDTGKLWSADKVAAETESLKEAIVPIPTTDDSTATGIDLDVSDEDGNVLLRLQNGQIRTKAFNSAKYSPVIITLKADGSGDYATLRAALDAITDADPVNKPYEIHLKPGTYDTLAGFTAEEIAAADIGGGYTDQSMVGAKTKDGVSIIGDGDAGSVILTAELSKQTYSLAVRGNISTLNLKGTGRIENLTIKAKNIRYCVHDDFDFNKRYERIVRNCVFVSLGSLAYNPATTYGSGIRVAGCDALFENCDFGQDWGMHTKTNMTGNSTVILNNCKGLKARIGDSANESDTARNTFVFNNCDFAGIKITRGSATTPHVEVIGVNNPNTMDMGLTADKPKFMNLMQSTLSALPVGTFVNVGTDEIEATSGGITAIKATNVHSALGVIVMKDTEYDYIQKEGYIRGDRVGLSNLDVGDYVTVDSDMKLTTTGATASNAVGVVRYTDSNDQSQIWLM